MADIPGLKPFQTKAVRGQLIRDSKIANPRGVSRSAKARLQKEAERDLFARTALVSAGFRKADLSLAMSRVRQALSATQIKVAYDPHQVVTRPDGSSTTGKFVQSNPFVDHRTRLAAADIVMGMIPGMKAPKDDSRTGDLTVEVVLVAPDGTKMGVRVG